MRVLTGLIRVVLIMIVPLGAVQASEPSPRPSYALVLDGRLEDGSINEAAMAGAIRARDAHGIAFRHRVAQSPDDAVLIMRSFAQIGVTDIAIVGYSNIAAAEQVVPEFPEVRFTVIDGVLTQRNVRSVVFREEEAAYLAGLAAGLHTETGTVGFVGGMPIPPIRRFGCGYVQGVLAARPDAIVLWQYLGTESTVFRDSRRGHAAGESLIAQGADVVFHAAGFAGAGTLDAVAAAGGYGIGVDVNQNGLHPGQILTSALKRTDLAISLSWADAARGAWSPGVHRLGLATGAVELAYDDHNAAVIAAHRPRIDAAKSAIIGGDLLVLPPDRAPMCQGR